MSLQGKVVLVVGASSGIGKEIALLLAKDGALVYAAARRIERLLAMREELGIASGSIKVFEADCTQLSAIQHLAEQVHKDAGAIDILVFAAGTNTPDRAMTRLTPEIWDTLIQTNLNGAFYATHAVLPLMREKGAGHLIYISSISGILADVSGAAYQASKRGLNGMAHAIRVEERQHGIRTCVVCPGLVDTEILEKRPVKPSAEILAEALQPGDVAELVLAIAKLPAHVTIPEVQIMPTKL